MSRRNPFGSGVQTTLPMANPPMSTGPIGGSATTRNTFSIVVVIAAILLVIAILVIGIITLICISNAKSEIKDLHQLKKCDHLSKGTYDSFFKHFDEDFIHKHYTNNTVVCLDGDDGMRFEGYYGLKDLFYYLHRLQYRFGKDFFEFGNSYASADCDDTCVMVIDYDCNIRRRRGYGDNDDESDEEDNDDYGRRHRRRDPCKKCHAFVHFHLDHDDYDTVKSAHVCYHDVSRGGGGMGSPTPPPPPPPPPAPPMASPPP